MLVVIIRYILDLIFSSHIILKEWTKIVEYNSLKIPLKRHKKKKKEYIYNSTGK